MSPITTQALLLIAVYAIVWQGYKLRRRINGFAHVALLVFVVGTLLPQLASVPVYHGWLPANVASIVAGVTVNVPIVGLHLFRLALEKRRPTDPRVLLVIGSAVAIATMTVVLGVITIRNGAPMGLGETSYEDPASAVSSLVRTVYWTGMIWWFGVWVFRFTARPGTPRRIKLGMRVAGVGILAMGCVTGTSVVRGVLAVVFGHPIEGSVLPLMIAGEIVAGTCWAAGLSYPLIASRIDARRSRRRQRRDLDRIEALWEAGLRAFPEVGLPEEPGEAVDFQLRRRTSECYDVLHHLRLIDDSAAAATSPEAAGLIRTALDGYERRHGVTVWDVIDRNRDADTGDGDLRLLVELSELVADLRPAAAAA